MLSIQASARQCTPGSHFATKHDTVSNKMKSTTAAMTTRAIEEQLVEVRTSCPAPPEISSALPVWTTAAKNSHTAPAPRWLLRCVVDEFHHDSHGTPPLLLLSRGHTVNKVPWLIEIRDSNRRVEPVQRHGFAHMFRVPRTHGTQTGMKNNRWKHGFPKDPGVIVA